MQARTIALCYLACAAVVASFLYFGDDEAFGLSLPRALQFVVLGSAFVVGVVIRLGVALFDLISPREPHLSGSRFAAAAGIHPFVSRVAIWKQLTGKEEEVDTQFSKNAKDWGIKNESNAVEVYAALRANKSIVPNRTQYRHRTHRWLTGIPDALIIDTKTGKAEGILEVKCRYAMDMAKVVPHQTMSAIFYHMPQVQGYMEILDVEYCDLMSYTPKGSVIFRINRDRKYWLEMLPVLVDFWTHMRRNTPPAEKHENSALLEKLSLEMDFTEVEDVRSKKDRERR